MLLRNPIILANWKMNKTRAEAAAFCRAFLPLAGTRAETAVCAPFPQLDVLAGLLAGSGVGLGAQNFYPEAEGAFTGEVSLPMLQELGVTYVLIGHSERRHIFGEDDALIQRKVRAALDAGLQAVLCVGERLQEREAGQTLAVCAGQLYAALEGISEAEAARMVVAYEPVWAIGTGRTATADDAQAVIAALRRAVRERWGAEAASRMRFQYGGSVRPENIASLMAQPDIDGALVGGASLDAERFAQLLRLGAPRTDAQGAV